MPLFLIISCGNNVKIMTKYVKVSIVTVCFNAIDVIEKTILSVIEQTFIGYEFIIVDGGSSDGTLDVIKRYENRISKWISEPDNGIYNAMNKGVLMASGEYIIFMNAGDTFYNKEALVLAVSEIEISKADVIVGKSINKLGMQSALKESELSLFMIYKYGFCHQAAFIRRNLLIEHPYDEDYRIASDSKFFLEVLILFNATYQNIQTVICNYAPWGISSNRPLHDSELKQSVIQLFGERVAKDVFLLDGFYNPLLRTLYLVSNSKFMVSCVYPILKRVLYFGSKAIRIWKK